MVYGLGYVFDITTLELEYGEACGVVVLSPGILVILCYRCYLRIDHLHRDKVK
jgi:hypothetical protein